MSKAAPGVSQAPLGCRNSSRCEGGGHEPPWCPSFDGGIALNRLNRLFWLLILAVSLSLTGVSSASATDYYVSTSGSDSSGDGSAAHPWATIAYASTRIGPGAIVHVAPGTYTGSFNTRASGTSSAYVTYISDTKWGAKIVAGSDSTWSNYGAYVAIQGFDVTGPTKKCCEAIYTSGNATKIIGNNVH